MKLSEEEKKELLESAQSSKLRDDFAKMEQNRHNPFVVNGQVNMDRLLTFLTEYNSFLNHRRKPFQRIIDKDMRF